MRFSAFFRVSFRTHTFFMEYVFVTFLERTVIIFGFVGLFECAILGQIGVIYAGSFFQILHLVFVSQSFEPQLSPGYISERVNQNHSLTCDAMRPELTKKERVNPQ